LDQAAVIKFKELKKIQSNNNKEEQEPLIFPLLDPQVYM